MPAVAPQPVKPFRWAPVGRGLVAPEWQWAWNGVVFAVPMWEAGGGAYELLARVRGTLTGAVWTPSERGIGIEFDGVNDWVSFGTDPGRYYEIIDSNEITLDCLFYVTNNTVDWQMLWSDWGGTGEEGSVHWAIRSGVLSLFIRNAADTAQDNLDGATTLSPNTWYHLCHTFKAGIFNVYVDGVKDAAEKSSAVTDILKNETLDKRIGAKANDMNALNGTMAYLRIWKRALVPNEVARLAFDPFGPFRMVDEAGVVYVVGAPPGVAESLFVQVM